MAIITNWDEFQRAALDLGKVAPSRTRFVTKYRHCDGTLELKVTDDHTCLQYRTNHSTDLKRWERLTRGLMYSMSNTSPPPEEPEPVVEPTPKATRKQAATAAQSTGTGRKMKKAK
ncbi:signal recognition particle, SRP9/SRP14 subunit [Syncephalis plumigaleata]|nr:signal recognition particle, SRP9/SRP14 subunit [Syncephalis plumigaleata]